MYKELLDLITRATGKVLKEFDPQDAREIDMVCIQDGLADIVNGTLQKALGDQHIGPVAYGSMKMQVGFYLGLAYARNYGIPSWIDKLHTYTVPFDKLLLDIQTDGGDQ
ncbi:hypothetical protein LCGC14_3071300 [marine sediment metagenome]|uniref:Uncharacterized protein n=1 Tax=marine sediment metagenome TaxID=412755 RepID=A0A0F8WFZ0_9ZZZZ